MRAGPSDPHRGTLRFRGFAFACALGRTGITFDKREGDGATPAGRLGLVEVLYRADRVGRPATPLPVRPIAPEDGWCDDPRAPAYNRLVRLPFAASHERLWRADEVYDILVVLDWNLRQPAPGRGSAIFLHVARSDYAPTAGCVALARADLERLLAAEPPPAALCIAGAD